MNTGSAIRYVLLLFATYCCLASARMPSDEPSSLDRVYSNGRFGFSYRLPIGFEFKDSPHANLPLGTEGLFRAEAASGVATPNVIVMVAFDTNFSLLSLKDFAAKFIEASKGQPGIELIRDAGPVQIADKLFYATRVNAHYGTAVIYKATYFTERRGHFLLWSAATWSQETLDAAIQSLNEISFHDDERDHNTSPKKTIPVLAGKKLRVSESESQAFLLRKVAPHYPDNAHGVGKVVLRIIVEPGGDVRDVTVISGNPPFTASAFQAIQQYRYKPYVWQDHRVEMETEVTIVFQPPAPSAR